MLEQEKVDLFKRVVENIRQTQRSLFERKAKLGEPVVIADDKGMPLVVLGEEALRRFDESERNKNSLQID